MLMLAPADMASMKALVLHRSGLASSADLSVSNRWRTLSRASNELEISSRRKISLLE